MGPQGQSSDNLIAIVIPLILIIILLIAIIVVVIIIVLIYRARKYVIVAKYCHILATTLRL